MTNFDADQIELRVCRPLLYDRETLASEMQGHYVRGVDYPDALVKAHRMFPGENLLVEVFKRRKPDGRWEWCRLYPGVPEDVRHWTVAQMSGVNLRQQQQQTKAVPSVLPGM